MNYAPIINEFKIIRPSFETLQKNICEWLAKAHVKAEKMKRKMANVEYSEESFAKSIQLSIRKFGCKEDRIQKRGHMLADYLHEDWQKMDLFTLDQHPQGLGLSRRSKLYAKYADTILSNFYKDQVVGPDDLIHVTCTGYNSPSAAQKLVSQKSWSRTTTVTHAYHMGCLAAIPAIRMGIGFLGFSNLSNSDKKLIDIVHTEMCSLHLNPTLHAPDQLVGQSLFADGFIKYSIVKQAKAGLKIVKIHEEIIDKTETAMAWECEDWGLYFTLTKEIPGLIRENIKSFIDRLLKNTNFDKPDVLRKAIFAIHPGGPKIIHQLAEELELTHEQIALSEEILFNYGNMSSATLPHIWEKILNDPVIVSGTPIIGLAFGPGLTICGILLEKL